MLKNAIILYKHWKALAVILILGIFASGAIASSSLEKNTSNLSTIITQSNDKTLKLAKGQYMMPGRCWTDCGSKVNHEIANKC